MLCRVNSVDVFLFRNKMLNLYSWSRYITLYYEIINPYKVLVRWSIVGILERICSRSYEILKYIAVTCIGSDKH